MGNETKKYIQTPQKDIALLFKVMMDSRVDPRGIEQYREVPHLIVLGTDTSGHIGSEGEVFLQAVVGSLESGARLPTLLIIGEGVPAFQRLSRMLARTEGIGEYSGQDHIEDAVLLELQLLDLDPPVDDEAWKKRVSLFVKSLRNLAKPYAAYVPVVNLHLAEDLTVGKVKFRRTKIMGEELSKKVQKLFQGKLNPPEELARILGNVQIILNQYSLSETIAEVTVTGHESLAKELAYDAVRNSINLLSSGFADLKAYRERSGGGNSRQQTVFKSSRSRRFEAGKSIIPRG